MGEALINIFISILTWIFSIVVSIAKFLFGLIAGLFSAGKNAQRQKSIIKIRDTIYQAHRDNEAMLQMVSGIINTLPEKIEASDRKSLDDQLAYCNQKNTSLTQAKDNIIRDLSNGIPANADDLIRKYKYIMQEIASIHYAMSQDCLDAISKKYQGDAYFINSLLTFSRVNNLRQTENCWEYDMNNIHYRLSLDNVRHEIVINALPQDAIYFVDRPGRTYPVPAPNTSHLPLYFNADHKLEYTSVRKVSEITHYDVYEYFETVHRLMKSENISDYAHKSVLTRSDAEDIEDNYQSYFTSGRLKQVAPPPVEYLTDNEKMPNGRQRWAQLPDLAKSGMLSQKGFIIGKMGYGSFIRTGDYSGHLLTIASPSSGKGVGVVIPNLLRHKGSAIVLDPKGENYIVTAQQRNKLGNKVFYYDPWDVMCNYPGVNHANTIKARINPFDYLKTEDPDFIDNARALASSLIVRDDPSGTFFYNEAETFLFRLIVSVCVKYPIGSAERNMSKVRTLLTLPPFEAGSLDEWIGTDVINDRKIPDHLKVIPKELKSWLVLNKKGKAAAFTNTYSFSLQATDFVSNQGVADSLKTSNIDMMQLKTNPQTLYLIMDLKRLTLNSAVYKPFIRLIVTSAMLGASVRVGYANMPKDRVLFMLDEIAQLGNLQYLPQMLSIYAGMGITVWTIWQDLAQIQKNYDKEWSSIVNNCAVQQYFGVNDNDTAENVSKKAGKTTVYKKTMSTNEGVSGGQSTSESDSSSTARGTSNTRGTNSGYSYQGFNYTSSGGSNESFTENETYTNSYSFSKSIQVGWSKSKGESVTQEVIDLITPHEVMNANAYDVQLVFYQGKLAFPILSGKIKYFSDPEYLNEHGENLTRERN